MRRRRFVTSIAAVVVLVLGLAACQPAKKTPPPQVVTTAPGVMIPAFQTGVVDYVNRCDPAIPTEVRVAAPDGTTVSVNGSAPQGGAFMVQVAQAVGTRFTFQVTTDGTTTTHHVRCLPTDFPPWLWEKLGSPQAAFYASVLIDEPFTPSYSAIFDTNGVPVWWLSHREGTSLLTPLGNGNFAIITNDGMEEYDVNGELVRTVKPVAGAVDGHDVVLLPNGNYVLATAQSAPCDLTAWGLGPVETCINHVFQELTPAGVVVGAWDTSLHIPVTETTDHWRAEELNDTFSPGLYDPWHYNSIESTGDGFVISFRHLDAIYKIDSVAVTGTIQWKLGGTPRAESLTLVDDPLGGISGQHDARALEDGTISLHDNGSGPGRQPRGVRYAIDTAAKTATLVQVVTDSRITSSFCCGSTRVLPGGNWVTGWGGPNLITENAPDGTRVFAILGFFVYRGLPLLPGEFTADQFRTGMDAQYAG